MYVRTVEQPQAEHSEEEYHEYDDHETVAHFWNRFQQHLHTYIHKYIRKRIISEPHENGTQSNCNTNVGYFCYARESPKALQWAQNSKGSKNAYTGCVGNLREN